FAAGVAEEGGLARRAHAAGAGAGARFRVADQAQGAEAGGGVARLVLPAQPLAGHRVDVALERRLAAQRGAVLALARGHPADPGGAGQAIGAPEAVGTPLALGPVRGARPRAEVAVGPRHAVLARHAILSDCRLGRSRHAGALAAGHGAVGDVAPAAGAL